MADAERATWAGRMPERPYVLVGQQALADPGRMCGFSAAARARRDLDPSRAGAVAAPATPVAAAGLV